MAVVVTHHEEDVPTDGGRSPTRGRRRAKGVTIKDVARVAGVSQGTVSRIINGLGVSAELKDRVTRVIAELHYQPSAIARSMRTSTTRTVGLVITDIANPVLAEIAKGAEEVLYPLGYTLIVGNTGRHLEREASLIKTLVHRRVDGLLVTVENEKNPEVQEAVAGVGIPVVLVDRDLDVSLDKVHVDHANGVRLATEYLISLGHRRIALITADRTIFPGRDRVRGYETALRNAGLPVDPELIHSRSLAAEYGFRVASGLLSGPISPPTAIIAGGNQIFEGVLEVVRTKRLRVPEQISLIACDDTPLTRLGFPPVTVVQRDLNLLGKLSAEMLFERICGECVTGERSVLLPTSLVVRESCRPLQK